MISFSIIPSLNSEKEAGELICSANWVKRICRRLNRETFVELACNPDVLPVPFSAFGRNAIEVLSNKNIFGEEGLKLLEGVAYADVLPNTDGTARRSLSMVPMYWLTKRSDTFKTALSLLPKRAADIANDQAWLRSSFMLPDYENKRPNRFDQVLMGSGLTSYECVNSGDCCPEWVMMKTTEGDVLLFLAMFWYGK